MNDDDVSPLNRCQTVNAKKLCIFDIGIKLNTPGQYDIGGTYTDDESDLWFFCYTSLCPGYQHLLNLFVCHRKPRIISVGVSKHEELTLKNNKGAVSNSIMSSALSWKTLKSVEADDNSFIKTFCFTQSDVSKMSYNTLIIPVSINLEPKHYVNEDIKNRIKLEHDFGDLLIKKENVDFLLKTPSQKQYKIHSVVLAAQSPVLRAMLKNLNDKTMFIDISDNDMELLLQFLYTGTIKDLLQQNCLQLLEIADRFQLKNLFLLMQHAVNQQITVENAIDIAKISEKYKLAEMQLNTFQFIKQHPQVLNSEGWMKLDDVRLTKKLLEYIYRDSTQE